MKINSQTFTVLSLDGGGSRGYLTALLLHNIEEYLNKRTGTDKPLGCYFDLIVGTSTGGIIALGLASGLTAASIASFYQELVPRIFSPPRYKFLSGKFSPRYSSATLRDALHSLLGDRTLADASVDVCITAVSLLNAKPRLYKSDYNTRFAGRLDEKLLDVALATSAAPTYFDAHSLDHSVDLVDGGLCANNPALIAVVEALQFERASKRGTRPAKGIPNDLILISVGTGEQPTVPYEVPKLKKGGEWQWRRAAYQVCLESQALAAHFQAQFLLGEHYLRVNPALKRPMELDDKNLTDLKNVADLTSVEQMFLEKYLCRGE